MKEDIITRIDYGLKLLKDGEPFDLSLIPIKDYPRWVKFLTVGVFIISIIIVPIQYKILILILLFYIFSIFYE